MKKTLAVILIFLLCSGCKRLHYKMPENSIPETQTGLAVVDAHVQSAQTILDNQVAPAVAKDVKPIVVAASCELETAQDCIAVAGANLDDVVKERNKLELGYAMEKAGREEAEAQFGYRAWAWLRRAFYWVIGSWVVIGTLMAFAGAGNPASLAFKIARFIGHLLPLMNPFTYLRDILREGKKRP